MKIYSDIQIRDFNFWSAAKERAAKLTDGQWDVIESQLDYLYPEGMSEGQLNEIFWFDFDTIVRMLGYDDEEDFDRQMEELDADDDEDDEE